MDYEELYEDDYTEYDDEDACYDYDWGYNEDEGFDFEIPSREIYLDELVELLEMVGI